MDNTKKDYTQKIISRYVGIMDEVAVSEITAINELVCFFNICFTERNNFYLETFNKKKLREVGLLYNQIKSNILNNDEFNLTTYLLNGIDEDKLKLLRFVIKSYINNYDDLIQSGIVLVVQKHSMITALNVVNKK